jgi:hypothetical protein
MRNAGGYGVATDQQTGKVLHEQDSFSCFHCNKVVFVEAKCDPADLGGLCFLCWKLVCPECHAKGNCDPLEEKLARQESAYHARRSYGI